MNKNIYINVVYNDGIAISHIFYATKQHLTISEYGNKVNAIMKVLESSLDFIIKNKMIQPVYLTSNEVILSNIINEGKYGSNKDWEEVLKKIKSSNMQIKAYTN